MSIRSLWYSIFLLIFVQFPLTGIEVRWIGDIPEINTGAAFGVPFEKGKFFRNQSFTLIGANQKEEMTQHWPLAFWPDGSVKWLGVAGSGLNQASYRLVPTDKKTSGAGIQVVEGANSIVVRDNLFRSVLPKKGTYLIDSIFTKGTLTGSKGKLIAIIENRQKSPQNILSYEHFESEITSALIEQSGPVRVVVKMEGTHRSLSQQRTLLPFTVRFYFYAETSQIKVVHSFVYNGDQYSDFIQGIGMQIQVPFRESTHNRHVRFSGNQGGLWKEPVKPIVTRYPFVYRGDRTIPQRQMKGQRVPEITPADSAPHSWFMHLPEWDSYKLTQLHSDGFSIHKRTNEQSSWLFASSGSRSSGFAMVGDVSGGMGVSVRDFWQSFPASLEIHGARSQEATLTTWFWSPDANSMDLRHYSTIGHDLLATYEDIQPGLSTPYGIARTSELTFFALNDVPHPYTLVAMEKTGREIYRMSCTPAYFHQVKAFGTWSLPNRSNRIRNWIENQLDSSFLFYQRAVEEHRWYGFWNYGDVMHTYDANRHMWRYDIGGYAWANTELAPGHWLWYSFLRTGRPDIFRMAEAMTKHTGEVDSYHYGPLKGLGTRHNVSHWGCGAKEARVGQAAWKRHYYYLTTDERTGDLMHKSLYANQSIVEFEPLRIAQPRERFPFGGPARLRWGPDWTSLAGNWFTAWERTENSYYLDKITTGMESLSKLPDNLFTGPNGLSYDPVTGKMWYDGRPGVTNKNHLATIMGGYEMLVEMFQAIDHPAFLHTFTNYALYYGMPEDDPKRTPKTQRWGNVGFRIPRLAAFAAHQLNDPKVAERAWKDFLGTRFFETGELRSIYAAETVHPPSVLNTLHENPRVGTNGTSQWGLNAIIMTELIGDWLDQYEQNQRKIRFDSLTQKANRVLFFDHFGRGWRRNWFVDGNEHHITANPSGLKYLAGNVPASDAHHSVLWTKREFEGNLKVEFDYTRLDSATKFVNILFLHATGSGKTPFVDDIKKWRKQRNIPAMRMYFNHMDAYHISFAAFENDNYLPTADYVRARRYLPETGRGLQGTELLPHFNETGLFQPGVKHRLTFVVYHNELYLHVKNNTTERLFHWNDTHVPLLNRGRIGIRMMGSRSAKFQNFKVSSF